MDTTAEFSRVETLPDADWAGMRDTIDRFLDVAALQPDAPAVACEDEIVSYASVERRVRQFAALFAAHRAPRVLVALPPGADAYAAMLAAGLAGGYYITLNTQSPTAKVRSICMRVLPDVVVGNATSLAVLREASPDALHIDADICPEADATQPGFAGRGVRHDIAYVIFTSGSTGTPKGVVIPRSALDHHVGWIGDSLAIAPGDRVSQYANIGFDLSVIEIYGALCYGASLHPSAGNGDRLMPARMIARERLTIWISVPSVVGLMMRAGQLDAASLATLRRLVFCGEPLLEHQVKAVFRARPDVTIQNTYGPTEATVCMSSVLLTSDAYQAHSLGSISIGEPVAGMAMHLVGGPSPNEGEIVIEGPQLALGYWNAPDLTERSFPSSAGRRLYHTGDWAERRGGRLYHRGRLDFQVKIRGYRIELDEVAVAFAACGYPDTCIVAHEGQLVAVVETGGDHPFDAALLRRKLGLLIEPYAVPGRIEPIDRLPRNGNDKIDRDASLAWFVALPVPEDAAVVQVTTAP